MARSIGCSPTASTSAKPCTKAAPIPARTSAIIERALFEAAQTTLSANRITRTNGYQADEPSLLGGLLVDAQGERMSPSHAVKNRKRYRYYVSQALLQHRTHRTGQEARIPAHEIEALVVSELQALLHDPGALLDLLTDETPDLAELHALLATAADLAQRWPTLAPAALRGFVRAITKRVVVHTDHVDIVLSPDRLGAALRTGPASADPPDLNQPCRAEMTLTVDARLKRCGGETKLIVPARAAGTTPPRPNPTLVKALARAHSWVARLLSGQASSIRAIAQAERLTERYVARIIPLAFLAPDITEAILEGSQPQDLTLAKLCQRLPLAWPEQRRTLGFAAALEHHRVAPIARPRPARHASVSTWPPGTSNERQSALLEKRRPGGRGRARRRHHQQPAQARGPPPAARTPVSQDAGDQARPPQPQTIPPATKVTHRPATDSRHLPLAGAQWRTAILDRNGRSQEIAAGRESRGGANEGSDQVGTPGLSRPPAARWCPGRGFGTPCCCP